LFLVVWIVCFRLAVVRVLGGGEGGGWTRGWWRVGWRIGGRRRSDEPELEGGFGEGGRRKERVFVSSVQRREGRRRDGVQGRGRVSELTLLLFEMDVMEGGIDGWEGRFHLKVEDVGRRIDL